MNLRTCREILVLELIGDCSWQKAVSVHYLFKLPVQHYLDIFIRKKDDEYSLNKIHKRRDNSMALLYFD